MNCHGSPPNKKGLPFPTILLAYTERFTIKVRQDLSQPEYGRSTRKQ